MTESQKAWIDQQLDQAKSERDRWQINCIRSWIEGYFHATIEAATGSGKLRIGIHAIRMLRRDNKERSVIVVVPTRQLKSQWERELKKWKVHNNVQVWVVNSVIKGKHSADLLIWDEIHQAVADTFIRSFECIDYKYVLGLTATIKRRDNKDLFLQKVAPVVERLSMAEARAKGFVANFTEYHVGIDLSEEDQKMYDQLEEGFVKNLRVFSMDFDIAKRSLTNQALREQIASRIQGYDQNNVFHCAINAMKYIRKIKKFVVEHPAKVKAAIEIINHLDGKVVTFGESISTAESLSGWLGKRAMSFHSQMEPIEVETFKDKEYKTERGARKFVEANPGWEYKFKHNRHVAQTRIVKKIAGKTLREHVLHKIQNTKGVNVLCTAKALQVGWDFQNATDGIVLSRSSSAIAYTQTVGRIARLSGDKDKTVYHLYLKNTRDAKWLARASKNAIGFKRLDGVEELLTQMGVREVVEVEL